MVQCLTAFVIKSEPEFHSQNLHVGGRDQLLQAMFNLHMHDWYFCAPHTQNKKERERDPLLALGQHLSSSSGN